MRFDGLAISLADADVRHYNTTIMDDQVPPIYPNPPPLRNTAPARPRRSGRGWMVLSLILIVILAALLARDFLRMANSFMGTGGSARHAGRELQEVVVEDNDSENKVALIEVVGLISGGALDVHGRDMVTSIRDQLKLAAADNAVKAVLLKVDSPGGEVMAADEIYRAVADFEKTSHKPAVASMGGLAASGGYYVSAPCQWIVANQLTITGSIGVIMHSYNYRALMDKVGVRPEVFKSGRFKDMLSGEKRDEEILPEEKQMVQSLIDRTFGQFTNIVYQGRQAAQTKNRGEGRPLTPSWTQYVDGRILLGQDAYQYGFVDEIGDFDAAFQRTKKIVGVRQANLVRYVQPFSLLDVLGWFAKADPPTMKIDLGIDLPKLHAGYMYFLSPTLWH
jgi:protease-4